MSSYNKEKRNYTGWIVAGICMLLVAGTILILVLSPTGQKNNDKGALTAVQKDSAGFSASEATVYKTASCGCCRVYTKYLPNEGLKTNFTDISQAELDQMRKNYGIPDNLASCHITKIGNYFVSGHVPIEAIAKLLAEKPDVSGIALAGMPTGTPGMPGPKNENWVIYSIEKDGSTQEFMTI